MTPRPSRTKIRREITALVEGFVREQGKPWYQCERNWPQCPLVNPMCPDDLCVLPQGHVGTEHGWHVLGTTNYTFAEQYPLSWMMDPGTPPDVLIKEGYDRAAILFPDEPVEIDLWEVVPCRYCNMPAGIQCVTSSGKRTRSHESRVMDWDARDAR